MKIDLGTITPSDVLFSHRHKQTQLLTASLQRDAINQDRLLHRDSLRADQELHRRSIHVDKVLHLKTILTDLLEADKEADRDLLCGNQTVVRSSGEEPASPRHRAGVASMAWRP